MVREAVVSQRASRTGRCLWMLMGWQRRAGHGWSPGVRGRGLAQADHHMGKNKRKGLVLCAGKSAKNLDGEGELSNGT